MMIVELAAFHEEAGETVALERRVAVMQVGGSRG